MRKRLTTLMLALLALTACAQTQESLPDLSKRVFDLAREQYTLLEKNVTAKGPGAFPRSFEADTLRTSDLDWWCSGFFPGSLWYIWQYTGDEKILQRASFHTNRLSALIGRHTDHDLGFQLTCSFGHAWRLTGRSEAADILRKGAAQLAQRFDPQIGCIRSWDFGKWNYPVIIDNMMNLELLLRYGTPEEQQMGIRHAETTLENHFREDFTSWHLVDYAPDGSVRGKQTVQGLADDSAWARGQAWALYGYAMLLAQDAVDTPHWERFCAQAEGIARMLLERLPEDGIPLWDFNAEPGALRDASAGAIMAAGFLRLADYTADEGLAQACRDMAERQVRTLASPAYLAEAGEIGGFLLRHSVGNLPSGSEVDVPLTYADYYFLEAILRLNGQL